jgi:(E)-4-hydroxy-3-methyl-but-2-enyl pyrophosphate reductase
MKIIVAKTAGFCMGVRRAVEMVLDASKKETWPIYTFGPLIHNPQVLNILEEKGIRVLDQIPKKGSGTVLIRAHGIPPDKAEQLRNAGFNVIDATCPRVIKVQTIIKNHGKKGYASIIVGDRDHAEVIGLLGYAGEKKLVIGSIEQLDKIPVFEKAIIVAQTTQNTQFFEEVKNWFRAHHPNYQVFDTICDSTEKRQNEVKKLSQTVDAVIVVGGFSSANTQRLYEISQKTGKPSFHVEDEFQIDLPSLRHAKAIGVTAGASTPNWVIRRVYRSLESIHLQLGKRFQKFFFSMLTILLFSNVYLSLGALCLCYACTKLQGIDHFFPHGLVAYFYVQSMHIFNNLTGRRSDRYNDPDKAIFYDKNKSLLITLALLSGIAGIFTALASGPIIFLLFLLMSFIGLLYNMRMIPRRFSGIKSGRMKDIPASKTILIALAWALVTSIFVPLSVYGYTTVSSGFVFLWSAGLVFVRTAFFDILDMHGDRMVGRETLPIVLGEKSTILILKSTLGILTITGILASAFQLTTNLGYALAVCPLFFLTPLMLHEKGYLMPSLRLEFLIETIFLITGMITGIWVIAKL